MVSIATFCNRCGDAVEEGDELAELDALSERLRLKLYDLKRELNQLHIEPIFCNCCRDAGYDPWDELAKLVALLERLRFKRYDLKREINESLSPIAPIFCNRCGNGVVEVEGVGFAQAEFDALLEHLRPKLYDLKRELNQFHSPIAPTFCNRCGDAVDEGCDPWDELAKLVALLERLRLKRYDLKRNRNQFHSAIVRQLHWDVTSIIFEFCLPDSTNHSRSHTYTKEDLSIPLSLGAICSYWREIAWSMHSLWSSLVIRVTKKHDSRIIAGIAQEWLARSGQLPLSISIFSESAGHRTVIALANIINQHSTRWSDLDLYMPPYFYECFHASDNHAPVLKSIQFRHSNASSDESFTRQHFQLTSPRLERAYLSFVLMDIQWDNLTHLTLHSMSIVDSFFILPKCPRLAFCKVSGHHPQSWQTRISLGEPVLTSLKSLQLFTLTSFRVTEDFLNNLIAPHLEEFSLPRYYYDPSMEPTTSFFRRSACSLRSFSMIFSISPSYFERFMSLLQSMPSLNTLSISTTNHSERNTPADNDLRNILQLVAKILSSQSSSLQEFLPNLKILEYTGMLCLRPGIDDDLYSLPPIDDAAHGPFHLLKLDLHPATHIPQKMIPHLAKLVDRGITVNVVSNSKDILQSSIDYYRCREDFLYRDWTDNLDLSLFS